MFTYNEVIEKLKSSQWPETAKRILLPVLPRLGKWSLSFVWQQINSTGSEFVADDVAQIVSLQPAWYDSLQKSQTQAILDDVDQIIARQQEDLDRALLAIILDIRTNKTIAAQVPTELSKLFDQVEVLYLKDLPVSEVANILGGRINRISEVADLQMEIKRYCYYRDALSKDDQENIVFREAIQNNEQLIGSKDPKSVKNWINDFLQAASSSTDRSMFNIVQYVTNNPAVKNLTSIEKKALSDILTLYHWLFQPFTTAEEIESYEKHRMGNELEQVAPANTLASEPPQQSQQSQSDAKPQPTVSKPQPATPRAPANLPEFDAARPTPSPTLNENKYVPPAEPAPQQPKPRMNVPNQYTANPGKIHDIINQKPKQKVGVVMDPTNIKLEEEKRRLSQDRNDQADIIQLKLAELRKRNKTEQDQNSQTKQ